MELEIYQIDAFTSERFGGNPAAVVPLEDWPPDAVLQAIAAENNLSETAYFCRSGDEFQLRWFTPVAEVDLCGHATLASAYVLFEKLHHAGEKIRFRCRSGPLQVTRNGELLTLDFPEAVAEPVADEQMYERVAAALGARPEELLAAPRDYLAVFPSAEKVRDLSPDGELLQNLELLGMIVTAPADAESGSCDFVSRFFAPAVGILEDPVTGSAHCTLVPYWAKRLKRDQLHARQISKRGGELLCAYLPPRVSISGRAVCYLHGTITV
ncbi:MAG: PhzF family phenazine biosynthesis protein [Planctomycetota bacterium]